MAPRFHSLTVVDIRHDTVDSVVISLGVPAALQPEFAFQPGQYLTLRAVVDGKDIRRSYSISSLPSDPILRVGVRKVDGGAFSGFANGSLSPGERLSVMTPQGKFIAKTGTAAKYLLIAAGSGITPMMSIAGATLAQHGQAEITMVYGNRQTGTIMFKNDLEAMKDRFLDRLTVLHLLSREEQDVPLLNGRIDGTRIKALSRAGAIDARVADAVFLCGPGEMIKDVRTALTSLGVDKDVIRSELFTPADGGKAKPRVSAKVAEIARGGARIEIVLDGSRKKFSLSQEGESVLDAARKHGIELPFSCAGGMCCTCRCKVISGSAEMAVNYSLEAWEIKDGFTLACQARPTTPKLVLDFDAS